MPIDFERKIAFIHIPKVAGTTIEHRYNLRHEEQFFAKNRKAYEFDGVTYAPQHLTPKHLGELVPGLDTFSLFCFVRHPYEKLVSEYYWLHKDVYQEPIQRWSERKFRQWIINHASKKNMDHLINQWEYAKGCDHIFRLEHLTRDIKLIDKWFGVDPKTPLMHSKKGKNTKQKARFLKKRTRELIYSIWRDDFDNLQFNP